MSDLTQAREIWRYTIAVTDGDWYGALREQGGSAEVNFWQPGASGVADHPGTPWLFKLHAPRNVVVGGGFFIYYARMPIGVAWNVFGARNGADSLEQMLERVAKYQRVPISSIRDEIGCVVLNDPFFLDEPLPVPPDWPRHTQSRKHYDLRTEVGAAYWGLVQARMRPVAIEASPLVAAIAPAVGKPMLVIPRLGQASFRLEVLDAYERRCAVTGERTLPVLDAAHIKPFSVVKEHRLDNGIALRSDIHRLYDQGYVTVTPDLVFHVSKRIDEQFQNGKIYYALDGQPIRIPSKATAQPQRESLEWHYETLFKR